MPAALQAPGVSAAGPAHWGSLHDAWQDATDARPGPARRAKEPLPAGVVIAVAEHRVRAIHVLSDGLEGGASFRQRIGALRPHARDAQGRNWDIPALDGGTSPPSGYETEFRRVVDGLRDQFDLA